MRRFVTGAALALLLTGCSAGVDRDLPLADGEFEGYSDADEEGAIGHITITVSNGRVVTAVFEVRLPNGQLKDENYGLGSGGQIIDQDYYNQAQHAVAAFAVYSRQLVAVGYPDDVNVVSGATWAHEQFVDAATEAMLASQQAAK